MLPPWLPCSNLTLAMAVPCLQAAFSDNPPVVYSPESDRPLPPPPKQSGGAKQPTLQPALSQVCSAANIRANI
jgi:hypothetical protein